MPHLSIIDENNGRVIDYINHTPSRQSAQLHPILTLSIRDPDSGSHTIKQKLRLLTGQSCQKEEVPFSQMKNMFLACFFIFNKAQKLSQWHTVQPYNTCTSVDSTIACG